MKTWSTSLVGRPRAQRNVSPFEFFKQIVTPEDSTGAGDRLHLSLTASAAKVALCVAAAFTCYAMIAQLQ